MTPIYLCLFSCKPDKVEPESFTLSEIEDEGRSLDEADVDTDTDTDTDADTDTDTDTDTEPPVDERVFGLQLVLASLVKNPLNASDIESSVSTSWSLVEWTRVGTAITWTERLCGLETTEAHGTTTTYPSAFVSTMPVRTREATLDDAVVGADFVSGPYVDVNGASLSDPWSDPLPTEAGHSAVVDQDGDGEPGLTVSIDHSLMGQGDVHVAQKSVSLLEGVVVATDRVEGFADVEADQTVLSATTWWLEIPVDPPARDPDPSHSWFVMQEMAAGSSCSDVLSQRSSLF